MSDTVTPVDVARQQDALTMGKRAGWNHRMLRADLSRPDAEWCALLCEIRVNPWAEGEHDDDPDVAARLARRWAEGWVLGDHAAQAQLRRGAAA